MVAFVGLIAQHAANGMSPLQALSAHVANPTAVNFASNVRGVILLSVLKPAR